MLKRLDFAYCPPQKPRNGREPIRFVSAIVQLGWALLLGGEFDLDSFNIIKVNIIFFF